MVVFGVKLQEVTTVIDDVFHSKIDSMDLDKDIKEFAKTITLKDLISCRIPLNNLEGPDSDVVAYDMLMRLYDMHNQYTALAGPVSVVCQHSNFSELPISKKSKRILMGYKRVELIDLWTVALHERLYDVTEVLRNIENYTTVRYVKRGENLCR